MFAKQFLAGCKNPENAVILLHGLGASSDDLKSFPQFRSFAEDNKTLFVFPQAPLLAVAVHGGETIPAWYNIYTFAKGGDEDRAGLERTSNGLGTIISELADRGIAPKNIIVGGFSQGGAAALYHATNCREKLAGVAAFSAYLPLYKELKQASAESPAIFMSHGIYDEIISVSYAQSSRDLLRAKNYQVFFQTYPLGHSIDKDVAVDFLKWTQNHLENNMKLR